MKLQVQILLASAFTQGAIATFSSLSQNLSPWLATNNTLLDRIIARGFLTVGTTGDYKPYSYSITNSTKFPSSLSANGTNTTLTSASFNTTYIGADIDTAQALSNALGLPNPVQFVPTIWANLTTDLSAGKFDIAMGGISITLARAMTAYFSAATQRDGKVACIRCSDAGKFTSLADIDSEGVVVVVNPGGTNEAFDRENLKVATIKVVDDNNAVYQDVLSGVGDVMISDLSEVELQMKLHEGELCMVAGSDSEPFNFSEKAYLLPRDTAWKNFVDLFVGIQAGSGSYNATLTYWMDFGWPSV